MGGNIAEVTVKLDLQILEESEKAREIIRMLIRDELKSLLGERMDTTIDTTVDRIVIRHMMSTLDEFIRYAESTPTLTIDEAVEAFKTASRCLSRTLEQNHDYRHDQGTGSGSSRPCSQYTH